ncbi:BTAD domain-containing putative transcriptional regulator [Streptomyces sp. NPDC017943]|uniref:AfsR/SARP family transcriptional regulator n=1 Tax=Streptomyces sp. NPDC017943 TaxID=3365019 RepID=UPI0037903E79
MDVLVGATGTPVVPPGSKQRALLAALVLHAGRLLTVDQLTEELWGRQPPANPANALHAHIARLRRLLPRPGERPRPGQEPESGHDWIHTQPTGYVLQLGGATTDVQRFAHLSAQGRAALTGDPAHAARLLHHALSLWRGPALADSRHGPLTTGEADRLEENRLTALESLYEAHLRCARHHDITGELEKLTADHPLHERFYDQLMTALYHSGRQAEALGVYERARHHLTTTLGVEPGPALRARLQAILHHAPRPTAPPPAGAQDLHHEIDHLKRRIDELMRSQEHMQQRLNALTGQRPASTA